MSAQTELAVVPPKETALQVFQAANGLDPYLKHIRDEIDAFVPDVTTLKGRKAIASIAYKVAQSRAALDNVGKDLVAELKEIPKKIDAERKRMRDMLETWQEEVRRPLNEWQAAEDARVDRHNNAIAHIKLNAEALEGITSEDLADRIEKVEAIALGKQWEEFEAEAARAKDDSLKVLRAALGARQQYEAEQAELARLRREADERAEQDRIRAAQEAAVELERQRVAQEQQAERDAAAKREQELKDQAAAQEREAENQRLQLKLQAEQAERARIQAEADRVAVEQRAEQQRQAAAMQAERDIELAREDERRRADEAAAEIVRQQQARERDQAHKIKIMGEAKEALMSMNITEELAKAIVLKIARREVPNITINF
ncbi:MAG: MAEBL protein [Podoviridae sp. ctdb7]|nr:MAG: MAEBL protein [Podoviridae sp. ctdb7]